MRARVRVRGGGRAGVIDRHVLRGAALRGNGHDMVACLHHGRRQACMQNKVTHKGDGTGGVGGG